MSSLLFGSREQYLAATAAHQALMRNLGIGVETPLGKSEGHRQLLSSLLRQSGNTHADSHAPSNAHSQIARTGKSPLDREAARKFGNNRTQSQRDEDEHLNRMSRARADNEGRAMSDIDREAERKFGERKTALKRQREKRAQSDKGDNDWDFSKLQSRLKTVLDVSTANADDILAALRNLGSGSAIAKSQSGNYGAHEFMRDLERVRSIKTDVPQVRKTIAKTHSNLSKALGVKASSASMPKVTSGLKKAHGLLKSMGFDAPAGTSSLDAGYGSDSATLTGGSALRRQSLNKSRVFGTVVGGDVTAAPKLTPDMIERAASAALAAGQITGAEANQIATYCAMGAICPEPLLKRLRGE